MKEWREAVKYLPRVDRAGLMRRCGSVLTVNMVALRQMKERRLADQRHQQKKKAIADCSDIICLFIHYYNVDYLGQGNVYKNICAFVAQSS